jgi:hypothetical protein
VADRDRVGHPCQPFSHVRLLINGLTHMHHWFMHVPNTVAGVSELAECVVGLEGQASAGGPRRTSWRGPGPGLWGRVHLRVIICAAADRHPSVTAPRLSRAARKTRPTR